MVLFFKILGEGVFLMLGVLGVGKERGMEYELYFWYIEF